MSRLRDLWAQVGPGAWPLVWQGVGALLIGMGLGALIFPLLSDCYARWQQYQMREEFERQRASQLPPPDSALRRDETTPAPAVTPSATPPPLPREFGLCNLVIDKIGLDVMVREWTGPADLRRGPVHDPRTAQPGEASNCVISGHRNIFGSPFLRLNELEIGDEILLKTRMDAHWYSVSETGICPPDGLAEHIADTAAHLTLVTCDPPTRATQRLFVKARLFEAPGAPDHRVAELLERIPDFEPDPRPSADWPEGVEIERILAEAAIRAEDAIAQLAEEAVLSDPPTAFIEAARAEETPPAPRPPERRPPPRAAERTTSSAPARSPARTAPGPPIHIPRPRPATPPPAPPPSAERDATPEPARTGESGPTPSRGPSAEPPPAPRPTIAIPRKPREETPSGSPESTAPE